MMPIYHEKFGIYDVSYNGTSYIIVVNYIKNYNIQLNGKSFTKYQPDRKSKYRRRSKLIKYSCNHDVYVCTDVYMPVITLTINGIKLVTDVNTYPNLENEIVMSTLVLNEDKYITQWIEYYRMFGITRFVIYDNNPKSNLSSVLKDYKDVIIIPWTYPYHLQCQDTHQNHSIWTFRNAKLIGFFDVDEYVDFTNFNLQNIDPTIGGVQLYSKNFINHTKQPEHDYEFLKITTCGDIIKHGHEKLFVIPRNVNLFSIHEIVDGGKTIVSDAYFNHYIFLNKPNRGRELIPNLKNDSNMRKFLEKIIDK
jgi:hypothetical protein